MATTEGRAPALAGRETAQLFTQRARAERRRRRLRWLLPAGIVLVLLAAVVVVARSSLVRVHSVTVTGARRQPAGDVIRAAAVPVGTPMWSLDTTAVADRVAALPRVRQATVSRKWPTTITIKIVERQPVAVVAVPSVGQIVVDSGAAEIERLPVAPGGLLPISLTTPSVADAASVRRPLVSAALAVAVALPPAIRARVSHIAVASLEQIDLIFADGTIVHWGNAARSESKVVVLTALLATPRRSYDVRAPETPAVR